ncbi:hypothetical protein B5807_01479 [Epicoccum nigrum]|uniref:Uncharacterized protein n=1 Tax=Epicoccum nigrum TaxID=105696 RepID=A0A1Y2MD98_EPING|nr:hypothetical protein B5807_01479 [Epicoccum nigrum]
MVSSSTSDSIERLDGKLHTRYFDSDAEKQPTVESNNPNQPAPKTLGSGTALAIGVFATTLTTLSLALMEWRGVTTNNVFVGLPLNSTPFYRRIRILTQARSPTSSSRPRSASW